MRVQVWLRNNPAKPITVERVQFYSHDRSSLVFHVPEGEEDDYPGLSGIDYGVIMVDLFNVQAVLIAA